MTRQETRVALALDRLAALIAEEHGSHVFDPDRRSSSPYDEAEREQYRAEAKVVAAAVFDMVDANIHDPDALAPIWRLRERLEIQP